jgi:hypothetical protein
MRRSEVVGAIGVVVVEVPRFARDDQPPATSAGHDPGGDGWREAAAKDDVAAA